jgi:putative zinc finger/helix-turn-helix YgiT family protein
MKNMKTGKTMACCSCKHGHYNEVFDRYETVVADDVKIAIPRVKLLRCLNCGDELLPPETQKQIDAAIAEQTEQLSPRELEAIWERLNLDQTETAEVFGLGSKTFHRWLNGTQYPSRSMGYYLRVLVEFPDALEWLKERGWRKKNRIAQFQKMEFQLQFPELAGTSTETEWKRRNTSSGIETVRLRFNPTILFRDTKM